MEAIDRWIDFFRTECVKQFAAGCHPPDVMTIAMNVANSKQTAAAQGQRVIPAAFGAFPQRSPN
jgi:hypothetical protein